VPRRSELIGDSCSRCRVELSCFGAAIDTLPAQLNSARRRVELSCVAINWSLHVVTLLCRFTSTAWCHWIILCMQICTHTYIDTSGVDLQWSHLSGQTSICVTLMASCTWATSHDIPLKKLFQHKLLKHLTPLSLWCLLAQAIQAFCQQKSLRSRGWTFHRGRLRTGTTDYKYVPFDVTLTCPHNCNTATTNSSALADRPRDASCLSVGSFNNTNRRASAIFCY